jgi:hypothetical protein
MKIPFIVTKKKSKTRVVGGQRRSTIRKSCHKGVSLSIIITALWPIWIHKIVRKGTKACYQDVLSSKSLLYYDYAVSILGGAMGGFTHIFENSPLFF